MLTPKIGTNDATFSPSFEYYTLQWSDANTPPIVTLHERSGKIIQTFTDNARVRQMQKEHGLAQKEFFKFSLADGTHDLLAMAKRSDMPFELLEQAAGALEKAGLLRNIDVDAPRPVTG